MSSSWRFKFSIPQKNSLTNVFRFFIIKAENALGSLSCYVLPPKQKQKYVFHFINGIHF